MGCISSGTGQCKRNSNYYLHTPVLSIGNSPDSMKHRGCCSAWCQYILCNHLLAQICSFSGFPISPPTHTPPALKSSFLNKGYRKLIQFPFFKVLKKFILNMRVAIVTHIFMKSSLTTSSISSLCLPFKVI